MEKKAQGLSLNTIIIAIIVLIVLVVIIMVFTGYFSSRFTPGVTSCVNAGGTCESKDDGCGFDAFSNKIPTLAATCEVQDTICCSKGLGVGEEKRTCGPLRQTCDWDTQECVGDTCIDKCIDSDWTCTTWSACTSNSQTRTCTLTNTNCDNPNAAKPAESRAC